MSRKRSPDPVRGFTLIEALVVITITGVIAAVVAVFIRAPVQGYFDAARRAEMSDAADTSLRRISRDLHLALPNSIRITGSNQTLEFLSTRTGGRYRAEHGTGSDDILDFESATDSSFDVLGQPVVLVAGDKIVIYNLGIPGADAYEGSNLRAIDNAFIGSQSNVHLADATVFPFDSPSHRFHVVDTPVTYRCNAGSLTRYSGYPISAAAPDLSAVPGRLLAQNVSACSFSYTPGVAERSGLLTMQLAITQGAETVTLYHAVHINNVP